MFYVCWSKAACHSNDTIFCAVPWVCMSSVCKLAEWEFYGNNWPINWFCLQYQAKKNRTPPCLFLPFTLKRENQSKNYPPLDTYCHSLSIFNLHCCFSQVQSQLPRGHRTLWQIAGPFFQLYFVRLAVLAQVREMGTAAWKKNTGKESKTMIQRKETEKDGDGLVLTYNHQQ